MSHLGHRGLHVRTRVKITKCVIYSNIHTIVGNSLLGRNYKKGRAYNDKRCSFQYSRFFFANVYGYFTERSGYDFCHSVEFGNRFEMT